MPARRNLFGNHQREESVQTFADRVKRDLGLERFSVYEQSNGDLILNLIIVPHARRGEGLGAKALAALVRYADMHGRRVVLTPDPGFGATSRTRLVQFYKRFGFIENKGRNKDFEISEGMYRNPR